jgi:hypothetical protein
MTWAVPQCYPPGYPAVTQGSSADPTNKWMIALEKFRCNAKTSHPTRAKPCPFRRFDRSEAKWRNLSFPRIPASDVTSPLTTRCTQPRSGFAL